MGKKINKIEITSDTITARGSLSLFNRYLENVGILTILQDSFVWPWSSFRPLLLESTSSDVGVTSKSKYLDSSRKRVAQENGRNDDQGHLVTYVKVQKDYLSYWYLSKYIVFFMMVHPVILVISYPIQIIWK